MRGPGKPLTRPKVTRAAKRLTARVTFARTRTRTRTRARARARAGAPARARDPTCAPVSVARDPATPPARQRIGVE